jgi:uncharacterized NAD(P)/FAD-binding protein YdhS
MPPVASPDRSRPGPLLEWARRGQLSGCRDPELEQELRRLEVGSFPSRRLLAEYLSWVFWRTVRDAPFTITVQAHTDRAVDVGETEDGRQSVWLKGRAEPLVADVVFLAQGHLATEPLGSSRELAVQARAHALTDVPEDYTADIDLSVLAPGDDVLVRGAGLSFIDLAVLLTWISGAFI